ncbi:M61 family metallopeptidase [Limnohabitans planktonicus]|uniref:Peptidase M61 n=1 Tax=Limnohabitans planktonicus II-D5 TaxID=1293045 RepID=A0A2T7UF37_9BURK|nr:M61 family metallopeptidase [Limnohabitans planktonicus]PVE43330.1 peptidase M61 [Limnohabitans planktonicus II-D5]|eukprot:gene2839-2772_t
MHATTYSIEAADLHAHLFRVTLTIREPALQQTVSLPVWIPGSYLVREFSKNLQKLQARQGRRTAPIEQMDKCTWLITCRMDEPLVLSYEVYAFDNSVRTAWLDTQRGFFNGTSLCLRVHGQEHQLQHLQLHPVKGQPSWQAATGLTPVNTDKRGFGLYTATDYDHLVDSPVELGAFWSGSFKACGIPHRFVVAGALPSFDGDRLLADTQKICETHIRFWHGQGKQAASKAPHKDYVFMLNAVHDGYGGLEHRNSTALICNRSDLPRQTSPHTGEGYTTLLGLISHEYFHTWNVKQLRPDAFARYDYTQENYTQLLWFFEGFTSYYDDLLLRRSGLIDDATYIQLLGKTIAQVQQTPGRQVQTVAQASFDAWVKYYRQDENTPNATVSYYTKGALVALCLDLTLRQEFTAEGHTLDSVMHGLWKRCKAGPMRELDLLDELQALTGRSWQPEIKAWVHSTTDLPLRDLLSAQGIEVSADTSPMAQRLGLRVIETGASVQIKAVLRGSAAEAAGLAAGDEWLGLDVGPVKGGKALGYSWRLSKLDDLPALLGRERQLVALVSRDKRLLRLPLTVPALASQWKLSVPADRKAGLWPAV